MRAIRDQLGSSRIDVAFLFISAQHADQAEALSDALRTALDPETFVGCTGEGMIATGREVETGPRPRSGQLICLASSMQPLRLSFSSVHDQFSLHGWPRLDFAGEAAPVMLLFADPFSTPMQDVLTVIEERYPDARALGGLAGGGQDIGENRLFLDDQVYTDGLVGVALGGNISVRTVISQGCRPIGDRFIVTKAEHNVIQELGGVPALHCLQTVFGQLSTDERAQAQRALHIGIAMDEQRAQLQPWGFSHPQSDRSRSTDRGHRHRRRRPRRTNRSIPSSRCAIRRPRSPGLAASPRLTESSSPLGALLFSCCGRGRGLFGRPHHDAARSCRAIWRHSCRRVLRPRRSGPGRRTKFPSRLHGQHCDFFRTRPMTRARPSPLWPTSAGMTHCP